MDNDLTPQLLIKTSIDGVLIPRGYEQDGKIVLNIHAAAVKELELGNELVTFSARFGGRPHLISLPNEAIIGVFARENGQGIFFQEHENQAKKEEISAKPADSGANDNPDPSKRPTLRLVE